MQTVNPTGANFSRELSMPHALMNFEDCSNDVDQQVPDTFLF